MGYWDNLNGKHFAVLLWNSSYSGKNVGSCDKVIPLDNRLSLANMKKRARELANEYGYKCFYIRRGSHFHLTLPEHLKGKTMGNNGEIEYTLSPKGNLLSVKIVGDLLEEFQECENQLERESLLYENAYEPFYTFQNADQFGSNLSEAPCFLEELDIDDNGDANAIGNWYYFDRYMLEDFTAILARGESVTFNKVV